MAVGFGFWIELIIDIGVLSTLWAVPFPWLMAVRYIRILMTQMDPERSDVLLFISKILLEFQTQFFKIMDYELEV